MTIMNYLQLESIILLGFVLGSFINAWVWRTRHNKTITKGRSACPHCKHQLAWYDLVPVLSYLGLKGKCRYCHKHISLQYPIVELTTGLLFGLLFFVLQPAGTYAWVQFVILLSTTVLLMASFVYDWLYMQLPEKYMLPAIALGIISLGLKAYHSGWDSLAPQLIGLALVVLFYTALWFFSKGKWLGAGDIRIAAIMGLFLEPKQLVVALFATYIVGSIYGVYVISKSKQKRGIKIPFGPFMIIGLYVGLLFGKTIANWYLSLL